MQTYSYGTTDTGLVREGNEDFFINDNEAGIYIVCDGVGGNAAGEVASKCAAETAYQYILDNKERFDETFDVELAQLVEEAVQEACRVVYNRSKTEKSCAGMATTLSMLYIINNKAVMGHVGDCRIYLMRNNNIHQISNDHSLVAEMVKQGLLTKEKAELSPYANVITRSIGHEESVQVDTLVFDIIPDDLLLIASDGFTKTLKGDGELVSLLTGNVKELPEKLVGVANQRGGGDNSTVIVISAKSEENRRDTRTRDIMLRISTLNQLYMFKELDLKELFIVLEQVNVRSCKAGEQIIEAGALDNSLYIVFDGEFEVTKDGKHLANISGGKHFGEMALISDCPRSASVKALTDARLLVIERADFDKILAKHSDIGVKLLHKIAEELAKRLQVTE